MRTLTISGNLGHDPEIKKLNGGTSVANFDVAVRQNRPGNDGEYGTDWIRCAVFGNRVKAVSNYFHKGSHVVVSGDLVIRDWTKKDGTPQKSVELDVKAFDLPDNNRQQNTSDGDSLDISDDDLPF